MRPAPAPGLQPRPVTSTDLLKCAGIVLVLVDHHGFFFDATNSWWRLFGRVAAPIFFFLIGFARTRRVPWTWLVFGAILTAVNAWKAGGLAGTMVNILINFALLRAVILPLVERHLMPRPGALALLVTGCLLLIPATDNPLEYGTSGWLWALFGLGQRLALEQETLQARLTRNGLAAAAAVSYALREAHDFAFTGLQIPLLIGFIAGLTVILILFRRAPAPSQPPEPVAAPIRFCGRHSLEIYAVTLFVSHIVAYAIAP